MEQSRIRINGARLRSALEEMAAIGATPGGGVHRLALSDEDRQARDLFVRWLKEIDCEVTVDAMGNIFGRRPGKDNSLAPVLSGSHLDSQPKGGRFDGVLGVLGALEVLRTLAEHDIRTRRPLTIVNWSNEEGSRFAPAMVGSGVWISALDLEWAYRQEDALGNRFGDELSRIGYLGRTPCRAFPVHCYYEYHIEQGPLLERERKRIGAPRGILCLHWYDVSVEGESNQVGPTPMEGRHDALVAASEMILEVNRVPGRMGGNLVATVGRIQNYPNSRNIIPGRVHFTVDIRSWDDRHAENAWELLCASFAAIAERHGCVLRHEVVWKVGRCDFDGRLVQRVLDVADRLGYPRLPMVSAAGHDASYLSRVCPTAMIFVPSIAGRSHVEVEETAWEDCEAGCNVLLQCMMQSAEE